MDIVHENVARTFSYRIPEGMALSLGQRVEVPFARMIKEGVVVGITEECDVPPEKLRDVRAPLEDYAAVLPQLLSLARRMAEDAHCPLAEPLRLMLPAEMRGGRVSVKTQPVVQLAIPVSDVDEAIAKQGRSQKRRMLLNLLRDGEVHPVEELRILVRDPMEPLHTLEELGLVRVGKEEVLRRPAWKIIPKAISRQWRQFPDILQFRHRLRKSFCLLILLIFSYAFPP